MKRKCTFLIVFMSILMLLTFSAYAGDTGTAALETYVDHLDSSDEVKWYEFAMAESGDAIIYIKGLQEHWDGYTYHWRCKVYGADRESVIVYGDVRGYTSDYYGPTTITIPDLEAGTYYIQMASVSYTNPLMTTFTSDPYEISLIRSYHSVLAAYDGNGVQTFPKAGAVLWTFDGTTFLKLNDGECLGVLMKSNFGAVVPLLVSTDEKSVEYVISSTGERIVAAGSWHDEESGIDYFYSDSWHIHQYTEEPVDTASLPIPYIDTSKSKIKNVVRSVIDQREAELRREELKSEKPQNENTSKEESWLTEHMGSVGIFFLAALGVFFLISVAAGKRKPSKSKARSRGHSSGGSYRPSGHVSYGSGGFSEPDLFNASEYVHEHCGSQIYGLVSERDIETIESDPNLTWEEKEEAKKELEHQAIMYY